jgi:hypothetical protein
MKNQVRYNKKCIVLHVKYLLFFSDFNKTLKFWHIFNKYSKIKFHKNPSSGSQVVTCRRLDRDMTKLSHFSQFGECALERLEVNNCRSYGTQELVYFIFIPKPHIYPQF